MAGTLWQGQGMGQSGFLCSHTKCSVRALFGILKHRRTCTCLRSDSVLDVFNLDLSPFGFVGRILLKFL